MFCSRCRGGCVPQRGLWRILMTSISRPKPDAVAASVQELWAHARIRVVWNRRRTKPQVSDILQRQVEETDLEARVWRGFEVLGTFFFSHSTSCGIAACPLSPIVTRQTSEQRHTRGGSTTSVSTLAPSCTGALVARTERRLWPADPQNTK